MKGLKYMSRLMQRLCLTKRKAWELSTVTSSMCRSIILASRPTLTANWRPLTPLTSPTWPKQRNGLAVLETANSSGKALSGLHTTTPTARTGRTAWIVPRSSSPIARKTSTKPVKISKIGPLTPAKMKVRKMKAAAPTESRMSTAGSRTCGCQMLLAPSLTPQLLPSQPPLSSSTDEFRWELRLNQTK